MEVFGIAMDSYTAEVVTSITIVLPAALYILGLMEGRVGSWLFGAGILTHLAGMAWRWGVLGRIPLAEKHDTISFMALSAAIAYLALSRNRLKSLGMSALPLIAALLFVAAAHRPIDTLSEFMRSSWFYLHVVFYFASYGFFGVSACALAHYVVTGDGQYEAAGYAGASVGWILLSIGLFAGSVWFYLAYGTYWLWTSKELWISITWLWYGLFLHARLMRGLRGRPAAFIGAFGFVVALFTYFGVGTIIPAPPTFF